MRKSNKRNLGKREKENTSMICHHVKSQSDYTPYWSDSIFKRPICGEITSRR